MRELRLKRHLRTVEAIAASPSVRMFYIGVTSRDPFRYCSTFYNERYGFNHWVILADWLTEMDAKALEEYLQGACRNADQRRTIWRKAHPKIQRGPYLSGGRSPKPNVNIHSVYMAWGTSI